ncbi:MAG: DUF2203 domain-containing protein [Gaiellaceae bacterium]
MDRRLFTVAEANKALTELRPLAEEMVRRRQGLAEAEERHAAVQEHVAGNGAGLDPRKLAALHALTRREGEALARCVDRIQARGVLVKDLDTGLLDFPARRGGEDVLLCWRPGEPDVAWWHGEDEGFADRKPL